MKVGGQDIQNDQPSLPVEERNQIQYRRQKQEDRRDDNQQTEAGGKDFIPVGHAVGCKTKYCARDAEAGTRNEKVCRVGDQVGNSEIRSGKTIGIKRDQKKDKDFGNDASDRKGQRVGEQLSVIMPIDRRLLFHCTSPFPDLCVRTLLL